MTDPTPPTALDRRIQRLCLAREQRLASLGTAIAAPDSARCRMMTEAWLGLAILAAQIEALQDARDIGGAS